LLNAAYTADTWKSFNSILNKLRKFHIEIQTDLIWPLSNEIAAKFCNWLMTKEGLTSKSTTVYMNALATIHRLKCLSDDSCKSPIVKTLIKGKENLESNLTFKSKGRTAMSLPVLKIIGNEIAKCEMNSYDKQVLWSACCTSFFAACRMGELLPKTKFGWDKNSTLTWDNVKIENDFATIHFKKTKTRTVGGEKIHVFSFKGHNCCPLKALKKLKNVTANSSGPVFKFSDGSNLTKSRLNTKIRFFLKNYFGDLANSFSGHSFRAGIPTLLGKYPDLIKDSHIMGWGRWSSNAFLHYTKLRTDQKLCLFKKIENVLNFK